MHELLNLKKKSNRKKLIQFHNHYMVFLKGVDFYAFLGKISKYKIFDAYWCLASGAQRLMYFPLLLLISQHRITIVLRVSFISGSNEHRLRMPWPYVFVCMTHILWGLSPYVAERASCSFLIRREADV